MPSGPDAPALGSGPWESVLTDVRGPFTVALFQNDGAYASCFTSSSFTETSMVSSGGSGEGRSAWPGAQERARRRRGERRRAGRRRFRRPVQRFRGGGDGLG